MQEKERTTEVISLIRISASPEKRRELFLTISSLLDSIRSEEGCRGYRFYGEASEQDSFLLVGWWNTGSDWYRHLHSEHYAILRGSLGLLCQQRELNFMLLSRLGGIESFATPEPKIKGA